MTLRLTALVCAVLLCAEPLHAQDVAPETAKATPPAVAADETNIADLARFLGGAAIGLGAHEGGHILASALFGADPGVKSITYGPIPFFAITHDSVSPGREYTIAASGFFVQHATSEWLLTRHPLLRDEHAPMAKGMLAFNVLTSAVYATAAFGQFGPDERDTRAMADALGVDEPWVGAMILAPAAVDAWRYFKPQSRWAPWISRALKVGSVVAVVQAAR